MRVHPIRSEIQYTTSPDTTATLSDKEINIVEQVCGIFFYYGIAIYITILPWLSDISSEQPKTTENTGKHVTKLLNYVATNPDAQLQYKASDMQLAIHSDESYLSVSNSQGRSSLVHILSKWPANPTLHPSLAPLSIILSMLFVK